MQQVLQQSAYPPERSRRRRALRSAAAATVVGLGAAVTTWAWSSPAPASTIPADTPVVHAVTVGAADDCKTIRFGSTASADLLNLTTVDAAITKATASDLRLGLTHSSLSTKPSPGSAASAVPVAPSGGYAQGAATASGAFAAAPPDTAETNVTSAARNLDAVRLGRGTLSAKARWSDGIRCGTDTGKISGSKFEVTNLTILPNKGKSLLRISGGMGTETSTGLLRNPDGPGTAAAAAASVTLPTMTFFEGSRASDGSSAAVTVRVLTRPALYLRATGASDSSLVRFTPAVVAVSAADGTVTRVSSTNGIDLPVPADLWGLPHNEHAVVHLAPGGMTSDDSGRRLHASATTLRVRVTLQDRSPGMRGNCDTNVLTLGLGVFDASADAAKDAGGVGGASSSPSASPTDGGSLSPTAGGSPSPTDSGSPVPSADPSPSDSTGGVAGSPEPSGSSEPSTSPSAASPTPVTSTSPTPVASESTDPGTAGSASPSTSPSASGGAAGNPDATPTATATVSGGGGGSGLPVTGTDLAMFAGAGATLIAAGYLLMVVARRRRAS